MKTAGPGTAARGACTDCKLETTKDEVLFSVDCSYCVCGKCAQKPEHKRRLADNG
jgi:hypothetical protein